MSRESKVVSKLRRLAAASGDELVFRMRRRLATARQRSRFRKHAAARSAAAAWHGLASQGDTASTGDLADWLARHMRSRPEPAFLLSDGDLRVAASAHAQLFPGRAGEITRRALEVLAHRFSFLGISFEADRPIAWQRCPSSGYEWPRLFHADIDYESESLPDVKYTWELSRQVFLIECGKAYRLGGDTRIVAGAFRIIDSWIADNPYLQGINWTSALEVAMRVMSWLWTYQFCRSWEGLDVAAHARLIRSLRQHGEYLSQNLSFYVSPYNHLVAESTALYLLGCFLPELDSSWRERGWEILVAEVEKQFHPDGGTVEQSTAYHHFSLGFFLLATIVRLRRGEEVPPAMWARLERALEFAMWMTRPDGRVPSIGDADDARSIGFEPRPPFDFRNLLGLGAVLFRRGDMKYVAGELSEDVLWLLGVERCDDFRLLPAVPPLATSRLFSASGYAVMRGGWGPSDHFACFDCGPIAAGVSAGGVSSAAHGHSDLLSVELAPFGVPVIVDPGCWTYNGDLQWHRYAREIAAHNTVRVNGRSHARFTGRMSWSSAAAPEVARWRMAGDLEIAECGHRGFAGLGGRVRHRRALIWRGDGLCFVIDRLEGREVVDVDIFFHLSPACRIAGTGVSSTRVVVEPGPLQLLLQCAGPAELALEVIEGGDGPEGGWVAASYGRREPAPVLRFHGLLQLPASFGFACLASRGELDGAEIEPLPPPAESSDGTVGFRVRGLGEELLACTWTDAGVEIARRDPRATIWEHPKEVAPQPFDLARDMRHSGAAASAGSPRARILEVGPFPPPHAGWSVRIAHLQRAIRGAGHECIVLNIGETRAVPSAEYECVRSGSEYVRKLVRHASAGFLFHLHINGSSRKGWLLAYAALVVALAARRRPVLTFHAGTEQQYFPRRNSPLAVPVLGVLFRACAAVICNHESVRRLIVEYGVRPEQIFPIPAVSRQYLAKRGAQMPPEAERFAALRRPVILTCLKWSPEYAPDSVLRAIDKIVAAHPDAGVIVVASSADALELRRGLAAVGLADRSCCLAPLDHGEFLALLERVDVYVRSHRGEGVSSSVAEALALGTPVVANHAEHPDGVVTYTWGDTASLAAALNAILRDLPAARASIPPLALSDTLEQETELLVRCARAPSVLSRDSARAADRDPF